MVAVLLCVLWVRSYSWMDQTGGRTPGDSRVIMISCLGTIRFWFETLSPTDSLPWSVGPSFTAASFYHATHRREEFRIVPSAPPPTNWFPGFYFGRRGFVIPHWFFFACFAGLTTLGFVKWPQRFSLRTLLIATTLVAVVLGLIAWTLR